MGDGLRVSDDVAEGVFEEEGDRHTSILYGKYNKPKLQRALEFLKLDVRYARASGDFLFYQDGAEERPVLDLLGGYGSTILGHNHPDIVREASQFLQRGGAIHAQASVRADAARLAEGINRLLPSRYITTVLSTGTEAVEAALKDALLEWCAKRDRLVFRLERLRLRHAIDTVSQAEPIFVALEGAFHGKTAGRRSATSNPPSRRLSHAGAR